MRKLHLLLLLVLCQISVAQVPTLQLNSSTEKELKISHLSVDVEVVGNIAITTFDMLFYNPNDRILEGELSMPMKNGQEICRYALDINGNLREGVIVEKVKARQTFEAVVKRKIDPGIINKTRGNNFNTRIYPIPARGNKRVVLALSEVLSGDDDNLYYTLPFGSKAQFDKFELNVKIVRGVDVEEGVRSNFQNIQFNSRTDAQVLHFKEHDFKPQEPLKFTIPRFLNTDHQLYTCNFEGDTYFYLNVKPDKLQKVKRVAPEKVAVYWDNSHSASKRDREKELELLTQYLKSLKNGVTVSVVGFNYAQSVPKEFSASEVNQILAYIKSFRNDGATRIDNIDFEQDADQILLFSDGVHTIGEEEINASVPVFAFSSSYGSNYELLKRTCNRTNGEFIDLTNIPVSRAMDLLLMDEEKYLSCKYSKSHIREVYPKYPQRVDQFFEIAGILLKDKADLEINFGAGKNVTQSMHFEITKMAESKMVPRIWATKKIEFLNADYEKNKDELLQLSQKHKIITKNTSLLVLDRVMDYVEHNIVPPDELKDEYYRILESRKPAKSNADNSRWIKRQNQKMIDDLFIWYKTDNELKAKVKEQDVQVVYGSSVDVEDASETQNNESQVREDNDIPGSGAIKGTVKDSDGDGIPFANVVAEKSNNQVAGTTTDFYGNYNLRPVQPGTYDIEISSVGFQRKQVTGVIVNADRTRFLDIEMSTSSIKLDEIEVVEYRVPLISKDQTQSGGTVTSDDIYRMSGRSAERVAATVGGVYEEDGEVQSVRGAREEATTYYIDGIKVRGRKERQSSIKVLAWMPDAPYMKELRKASDEELFATYYKLKSENENRPSFYIQVADLFFARGKHQQGIRILSNAIELNLEDPELLKIVARRLLNEKEFEMAISLFEDIKELRPEEPQSHRDLAIAYEQNKQYQQALDLYVHVMDNHWNRFNNIKVVVLNELNALIALHGEELNLSKVNEKIIHAMPLDIRITIDWSTNDNDIDLWVIDPNGEKCYYKNARTEIGGKITSDFTDGYGPEEFSVKKALRGTYTVYVNYYNEARQTITGPVTVYATLTTNYGKKNEKSETITVQLKQKKGKKTMQVGQLEFEE